MSLLHIAGGATEDKLYVEDVFSTYLYTGNGSTQTINNGIDLAGKGGLVWIKSRSVSANNTLIDTVRGVSSKLASNTTGASTTTNSAFTSFNSGGFSLAPNDTTILNSTYSYVSWTFRKAPKFFDVVTYTGNGVSNRQLTHNLAQEVGMVIIKNCTTTGYDWYVWHKSIPSFFMYLNGTSAQVYDTGITFTATNPTSTTFNVGTNNNQNGAVHVAYLFAHDPSADGIIQCGSFTTDASGNATVNLGWEPQYLILKKSSSTSNWAIIDTIRGFTSGSLTGDNTLYTDVANAENPQIADYFSPISTGFNTTGALGSGTYIYLAIRRPNKVPTSGTEVYNAIARTGTGTAATVTGVGFAPDLVSIRANSATGTSSWFSDRLRGATKSIRTQATDAESDFGTSGVTALTQDGITVGTDSDINGIGRSIINHFFKRAPKFMDIVCYTGTGVARTVSHNLGVVPELMIIKSRSLNPSVWAVYPNDPTKYITISSTNGIVSNSNHWNGTPTLTLVNLGTNTYVNSNLDTYVAYLFATLQGVSKIGSYTGNGTTQTINCGFSTGARFILIKRTDSTGDWYIWDTVRGIVAANDPHLSLNTTAAEVTTDDSVDPEASGFIVNQNTATDINVNGASYIFLAIA